MILKVEKNPCHQIPTTCDGAIWQYQYPPCGVMRILGGILKIIQTLILAIHYEHSF
jgi:hypothetical protein